MDEALLPPNEAFTSEHEIVADPFVNLSLYIPRVFPNINKKKIIEIFHKLRIGRVAYIDLQRKIGRNGKPYNSVFVHFEFWYDNVAARNFQARVLNPAEEAHLVYDDPWHWVVLENKPRKMGCQMMGRVLH